MTDKMNYKRTPIPKEIRNEIRQKFGGSCAYCGCTLKKSFHVDHVIPVAMGGIDDVANYFPACAACNGFKSDWSLERFREELENQVLRHLRFTMAVKFLQATIHPSKIQFHFEKQGHVFDADLVLELMKRTPRLSS